MKSNRLIVNVKTGEKEMIEEDYIPQIETPVLDNGSLDFVKLKKVLKSKGIIADHSEVE